MNPITVVASGKTVQSATGSDILVNSKTPMTKLDTRNPVSFQTISLLFNSEPPQPDAVGVLTNTPVYQFAHGYKYIPACWMMWQNNDPEFPPTPAPSNYATVFYPFGDDSSGSTIYYILQENAINNEVTNSGSIANLTYNSGGLLENVTAASLFLTADATNIYLSVFKYVINTVGGTAQPLYLAGVTLNIRVYVFAEPATTSSY